MTERCRRSWAIFRWWIARRPEKVWMKLAWALPRSLAYWATIRVGAHATTGIYGNTVVPDLAFVDALKRWEVEA